MTAFLRRGRPQSYIQAKVDGEWETWHHDNSHIEAAATFALMDALDEVDDVGVIKYEKGRPV